MCPPSTPRRTVLTLLGSVVLTGVATTASADSRDERDRGWCENLEKSRQSASADALTRSPDTFVAVVDRIVDDRFVVLLLEDEGRVVDELVVPREELPVDEGDVLLVRIEDGELREHRALVGETRRRRRWNEKRLECLRRR